MKFLFLFVWQPRCIYFFLKFPSCWAGYTAGLTSAGNLSISRNCVYPEDKSRNLLLHSRDETGLRSIIYKLLTDTNFKISLVLSISLFHSTISKLCSKPELCVCNVFIVKVPLTWGIVLIETFSETFLANGKFIFRRNINLSPIGQITILSVAISIASYDHCVFHYVKIRKSILERKRKRSSVWEAFKKLKVINGERENWHEKVI